LIDCPLERFGPRRGVVGGRFEEIQLRPSLEQPVHRHRHRAHRDTPCHRQREGLAGSLPELVVQCRRGQRNSPGGSGTVGVLHFHHHPPGGESAPPQPQALGFGEPAQQRVQDAEIVGVGGECMGHAVLRSHFRRQHRPRIDAAALRREQPSPGAEDRAQLTLGDLGHLADPLELIFVEAEQNVFGNTGEQLHRMGRQEGCLAAARNQHWPWGLSVPPYRPAAQPPSPRRRLRHQLVHRCAHGQRETESRFRFPADPLRDVH